MSKKNHIVNNAYRCTKLQRSLTVFAWEYNVQKCKYELQTLVLNKIKAAENNDEE